MSELSEPDTSVSDSKGNPDAISGKQQPETKRRGFLSIFPTTIMAGGLVAGYGTLAAYALRFLFPAAAEKQNWQFVSTLQALTVGQSIKYKLPSGEKVVVSRQQEPDAAESFIALSSVCPHLGCAVHWEAQNKRFFCPCHNGAFDSTGKATEGPPAAANQSLKEYSLKVEEGLLYIAVSGETLTQTSEA